MRSKIISLSAISAGFIAIVLTLGSYVGFADLSCIILSSVFVIMPLYLRSYKGAFLTYLVGGILGILFSFSTILTSFVLPSYFVFFGVYPIVKNLLRDKQVNKYLAKTIGLIWCVITIYGVYFYYTLIMGFNLNDLPKIVADYVLIFIAPFSAIFFVIYDKFLVVCKMLLDKYLYRIIKEN